MYKMFDALAWNRKQIITHAIEVLCAYESFSLIKKMLQKAKV